MDLGAAELADTSGFREQINAWKRVDADEPGENGDILEIYAEQCTDMAGFRKQIAFSLDSKALQKYYPGENWCNSYEIIKRHMMKSGFIWLQGSVNIFQNTMSAGKIIWILRKPVKANTWPGFSMRDCRETNIDKEHSKNHVFDKAAKIRPR